LRDDLSDAPDLARHSIDVYADDRAGALRDRGFDPVWIDRQRDRIDIGEDRRQPAPGQRIDRRGRGERRGDDLAGELERTIGERERERPVGDQREMAHAQIFTQRLFERIVHLPFIAQPAAFPDSLEQRHVVAQWGQQWTRDVDWFVERERRGCSGHGRPRA
jgi:hypothetical protein